MERFAVIQRGFLTLLIYLPLAAQNAQAPMLQRGVASAVDLRNGAIGTGPIVLQSALTSALPSGMILMTLAKTCPAGYTILAVLNPPTYAVGAAPPVKLTFCQKN